MTLLNILSRAAGLGLCVVAFTGTALADPGNGNGNGPATTPPGQEQKAETPAASAPTPEPAPQAAAGQEQKAENQAEQAVKQTESQPAAKPIVAKPTASKSTAAKAAAPGQVKQAEKRTDKAEAKAAKVTPSLNSQSANAHHHVIVCHRTGSLSNPYVVINIPYTAWMHAHSDSTGSHPDLNGNHDIMLKDPASRPGSKDGFTKASCGAPVAPATQVTPTPTQQSQTTGCPATTTTTERVVVGIKHYTGAMKNGQRKFVVISPSQKSAHMNGKHADDEAMVETRTVTRTTSGENCATVTTTTNTTDTVNTEATINASQAAGVAAVARGEAPAGGVAGAVSPAGAGEKKNKAAAGGVLGAVAAAPAAVAETATSDTLPFTGIPLWIVALIGGTLLAAGLVLRRTA